MQSVTCKEDTAKPEEKPKEIRNVDSLWIRISNLCRNVTYPELKELLKPFGPIRKRYLGKVKGSGLCPKFAYVHFKDEGNAQEAINGLNGYEYKNLVLMVEWSEPSEVGNILKHRHEDS